ncbi:MAG: PD-(D/E)XK nuclease family protein [bacterium]|nr:PD-(D/E)XK nuclease family protein [bacterium]
MADSEQNAIALERTGRDYISYSSISTYQRCPLKYYFGYVVGLEPEFVSSSLIFGGATGRRGTLRWRQPRHR